MIASTLWTKKQVAEYLGVCERTVERMPLRRVTFNGTGSGKKPRVRYDPQVVRAYVDGKRGLSR